MKILVITYNGDDWNNRMPLEKSPETRMSFEDFYEFAKSNDVLIYRASIQWYEKSSGCFNKAWRFSNGKWSRVEQTIRPDAVFDKIAGKYDYSLFETKQGASQLFPIINSPLFRTQFDNKLSQYLAFSEFMPISHLAENDSQLKRSIERIQTDKVVLKEVYGSGGKQVIIGEKKSIDKRDLSFPLLVQEFIETAGIPAFSSQGDIADLRLVYIGDELIYALSRIAKKGSLFTNFHQGANAVLVPEEKIPSACLSTANKIRRKLELFPGTNYSLDFMFTTDGRPIFIEMNTTPGFDLLRIVGTPNIKKRYYKKLLLSFFTNTL